MTTHTEHQLAAMHCLAAMDERRRRVAEKFAHGISNFEDRDRALSLAVAAYLCGLRGDLERSELRRVEAENRELRERLRDLERRAG